MKFSDHSGLEGARISECEQVSLGELRRRQVDRVLPHGSRPQLSELASTQWPPSIFASVCAYLATR